MPLSKSSSGCRRCAPGPPAPVRQATSSKEQGVAAMPRRGLRPRPSSGLLRGAPGGREVETGEVCAERRVQPQRAAAGVRRDGRHGGHLRRALRQAAAHAARPPPPRAGPVVHARRAALARPRARSRTAAQRSARAAPLMRGAPRRLQIHTDGVRRHALQPVRHRARLAGGGLLGCGPRAAGGRMGACSRAGAARQRCPQCPVHGMFRGAP